MEACSYAPDRPKRASISLESAGLNPSAVICEIMNEDGTMSRIPQLHEEFLPPARHEKMLTVADLIRYRMQHEALRPPRR